MSEPLTPTLSPADGERGPSVLHFCTRPPNKKALPEDRASWRALVRSGRNDAPDADVVAGVDAGAALAHDDGSGGYELAAEAFHAETFRLGIATIPRAPTCFLMCHSSTPSAARLRGR